MKKEDVIEQLCELVSMVGQDVFEHQSESVIEFIKLAVIEKIQNTSSG